MTLPTRGVHGTDAKSFPGGASLSSTSGKFNTTGGSGSVKSVFISWNTGTSACALTSNLTGTWTQVGATISGTGNSFGALFECIGGAGGTEILTATCGGGAAIVISMWYRELLNCTLTSPRETSPAGNDDTASPYTSNALGPTSQADVTALAYAATLSATGAEVFTWAGGFTSSGDPQSDANNNQTGDAAYQDVATSGTTVTSSLTSTGAGSTAALVFIAAYRGVVGMLANAVGTRSSARSGASFATVDSKPQGTRSGAKSGASSASSAPATSAVGTRSGARSGNSTALVDPRGVAVGSRSDARNGASSGVADPIVTGGLSEQSGASDGNPTVGNLGTRAASTNNGNPSTTATPVNVGTRSGAKSGASAATGQGTTSAVGTRSGAVSGASFATSAPVANAVGTRAAQTLSGNPSTTATPVNVGTRTGEHSGAPMPVVSAISPGARSTARSGASSASNAPIANAVGTRAAQTLSGNPSTTAAPISVGTRATNKSGANSIPAGSMGTRGVNRSGASSATQGTIANAVSTRTGERSGAPTTIGQGIANCVASRAVSISGASTAVQDGPSTGLFGTRTTERAGAASATADAIICVCRPIFWTDMLPRLSNLITSLAIDCADPLWLAQKAEWKQQGHSFVSPDAALQIDLRITSSGAGEYETRYETDPNDPTSQLELLTGFRQFVLNIQCKGYDPVFEKWALVYAERIQSKLQRNSGYDAVDAIGVSIYKFGPISDLDGAEDGHALTVVNFDLFGYASFADDPSGADSVKMFTSITVTSNYEGYTPGSSPNFTAEIPSDPV